MRMADCRRICLILAGIAVLSFQAFQEFAIAIPHTAANPSQKFFPLYLEENVLISTSEKQNGMMYTRIIRIAVDSKSNLYMIDAEPAVIKCNPQGLEPLRIGGVGEGPGEYRNPVDIAIDWLDRPAVIDQNRFVIRYNEHGAFRDRIVFNDGIMGPFILLPLEKIAAFSRRIKADGIYMVLSVFDREERREMEMAAWLEKPLTTKEFRQGGGVIGGILHRYSAIPLLCSPGPGLVCYGHNLEYRLSIVGEDGQLLGTIFRDEPAVSTKNLTRKLERKLGKERFAHYNMPLIKPFFEAILADDEGRIYVIRMPDYMSKEKTRTADVFDTSGRFLFHTVFPLPPSCIRNGSIYAIDTDDEGYGVVKRFDILNSRDMPFRK